MAEINKTRTRMYDPWGYQEENNYESSENQFEVELNGLIASAVYDEEDKKIHFYNNDGLELSGSSIDTTEFAPGVIEEAYYDPATKELVIVFDGGSVVRINMAEIIDEHEFGNGLQVDSEGIVSIKLDGEAEAFLTVGPDGLKLSGVNDAIETAVEAEKNRAISAETALDEKIDGEITRATSAETDLQAAINAEVQRAQDAEQALDNKIDAEIARATSAETALDEKIDAEIARATSAETDLQAAIDAEVAERKTDAVASVEYDENEKTIDFYNANNEKIDSIDATDFIKDGMIDSVELIELSGDTYLRITWNTDAGKEVTDLNIGDIFNADNYYTKDETDDIVEAEETRAKAAEQTLNDKIEAEKTRATQTEQALNHRIDVVNDELDSEESRAAAAEASLGLRIDTETNRATAAETAVNGRVDSLIEDLQPLLNDTLVTKNDKEAAFGKYNVSNTSEEPSGRTIFSIGIGTNNDNRKNALEVRENGDIYMWVEGDFMQVNDLIGMLAHETYDTNANNHNMHYDG